MKSVVYFVPLMLAFLHTEAYARPVTFSFAGEVTGIEDRLGLVDAAGITLGTPFAGFYTFDSSTPPDPYAPSLYEDTISAISGVVGGEAFFHVPTARDYIRVFDNFPQGLDQYLVHGDVTFLDLTAGFGFSLRDPTETMFMSTALPEMPPSLEGLSINQIYIGDSAESFSIHGPLTSLSLVPEPATLCLLAAGCTVFMRRRRTRKTN